MAGTGGGKRQENQGSTVFVNRGRDLEMLLSILPPRQSSSSFIVLKAPSGYGKTRLTTRLAELLHESGVFTVSVEPGVRAKAITQNVYQGFYVQRCAEALGVELRLSRHTSTALGFQDYLKSERMQRVKSVNWINVLRKFPGYQTAYGLGVELVDRFFNTGDHSPKRLLTSDSKEAVATCQRYIEHVAGTSAIVLILREAQHIDQASLNFFAQLAGPDTSNSVIFEYTCDDGAYLNDFFANLVDSVMPRQPRWLYIVELYRLNKQHLEELLRLTVPGATEISGEYYGKWDGNLRAIQQLLFTVSVAYPQGAALQLEDLRNNVVAQYQHQFQYLTPTEKLLLCVVFAHGEEISNALAGRLLIELNPIATKAVTEQAVVKLMTANFIVEQGSSAVCLDNEDVAEAIRMHGSMQGALMLARRVLRDHYLSIVNEPHSYSGDVSLAVRQALRISAEMGDMKTVADVASGLYGRIGSTLDQSWYVSQIVAAVSRDANSFASQRDRLLEWAAEMAYEISDFRTARGLLIQIASNSTFTSALSSACCSETGDHAQALELAEKLKADENRNAQLAGKLVELILLRCTGKIDDARDSWNELYGNPDIAQLDLYGYLLRFKELVVDFPECLEDLELSTEWFIAKGMRSSAAYSELTIAGHLARQGRASEAVERIEVARVLLVDVARDQHLILNNEVAVNMLSDSPDFLSCCEKLQQAIRSSGDDYSDLVLYTNMSISGMLAEKDEIAAESVNRARSILRQPRFADRDVFWGALFNLCYVSRNLGLSEHAELDAMAENLKPHSLQNEYWQHRYGRSPSAPHRFGHMLSKTYHPMFLSHWTIDIDGLRTLKRAPLLEPPGTSNPTS